MRIDVLTLFPEMFKPVLGASILGRAASGGKVSYHLTDIREHTLNKHGKVDDRPYGGGPGMVMSCQPIWDAVQHVESQDPTPAIRILTSPQGQPLTQPLVEKLAEHPRLLILAGHYEGIDQRVIDKLDPMPISIGDYVLSGGELPAMVLIDAVVRLLPGVLGHDESAHHDSFSLGADRILEGPHYTRPPQWQGMDVPDVLLSGDHAAIESWRKQQGRRRTQQHRPDLLDNDNESPV